MAQTAAKALVLPTVGGDSAIWGGELNTGVITALDNILGGVESIPLSASNYTFSASDIQFLTIKLTGTLLANVSVFTATQGFFIVENNTTGSFTVTIQAVTTTNYPTSGSTVGSGILIGQGSRNFFISDQTAGIRRADTSLFPSGTTQPFYNSSAPPGWTQVVTLNDYAMRIVSGTGGTSHSGSGFFGGATDGHTLVTGEIPSHNHGITDPGHSHTSPGKANTTINNIAAIPFINQIPDNTVATSTNMTGITINNTGGGGSHSHNLSGLSMLDLILCSKN